MNRLLAIALLSFGQETTPAPIAPTEIAPTPVVAPVPTPAPEPTITVVATPRVEVGHWVRIKVATTGTHPRVRVRQVLPGEDLYLPIDDGSGTTGILDLGNGAYVLSWSSGEFVIEADAVGPLGTITAVARSTIGDPIPPGPPPPVKTLADLAGDKAPALALAYSQLLEALPDFLDVDHFRRVEVALIAKRGLAGHGATAAIASRLNVPTLDALRPALEKVVAELGTPTPSPITATAVTYVYEKDQGGVPPAVHAALSELNAAGLRATTFEEDTVDGSGAVPEQYVAPLKAAREAGLPALVVTAGGVVKRVVKAPTTREAVIEATK